MNAVDFIKAETRLCDTIHDCDKCPLRDLADAHDLGSCHGLDARYPEELVAIVEKWAAEHPEDQLEQVGDNIYFDSKHRIVADEGMLVYNIEVTVTGKKEYDEFEAKVIGDAIAEDIGNMRIIQNAQCIAHQRFVTKCHEEEV